MLLSVCMHLTCDVHLNLNLWTNTVQCHKQHMLPAAYNMSVENILLSQGKISRQDVAELCVKLLSLPEALDTTFEIKSTVPFSQPYEADANSTPRDWQVHLRAQLLLCDHLPCQYQAAHAKGTLCIQAVSHSWGCIPTGFCLCRQS